MASAAFSINSDSGSAGFEASNGQVLTLRLRQPLGASRVLFQVWDPAGADPALGIAANPPRASKGAPSLTLNGSSSGYAVSPATPDGAVTLTMPGGGHSYLVRCVVNGGTRTVGGRVVTDPTLISERGIFTPTGTSIRKVVATETTQFEAEGWAGPLADLIDAGAPVPLYSSPGTGTVPRTIASRLNGEVNVTDWMTPEEIADCNDGTKLFDHQPAIQAAIDWLLFGSLGIPGGPYYIDHQRPKLRLPAGIVRIDRPVQINYGIAYRSLIFEGEGILRGGEHGMMGTALYCNFTEGMGIAVTAGVDVLIKSMAIIGQNFDHVVNLAFNGTSMADLNAAAWVDPDLPAAASSRYCPYAGIAIDPYCGAQPGTHYPDVDYPAGFGVVPQYDKPPSRNVTIEDVNIQGFVVAVALQPGDFDGSGDFVHLNRVVAYYNTFIFSWGNSQARVNSCTDCTFQGFHTAFASTIHGRQIGMPQIAVRGCSFEVGVQLFEIMNLGYGLGPSFNDCFSEAIYRLGKCNGQSVDSCGLSFRNCEFGFSWWDRYGVPTWVLECMGGHQVVFDTVFFYITATVRGYLGFRCSGSGIMSEPARQLQITGCQTIAPAMGANRPERCAQNGTLGIVVSLGSTSLDRFSVHNGYITNLDTNALLNFGVLHTEQNPAPRPYCAPVYAKRLKSLINGNDPGIPVAWKNTPITISTVVSTVGRVVTITSAGVTAASLAHTGGDVGDVLVGVNTGAAYIVKSRTGTTIVMEACTGFDKDGALLTAVVAGANVLYAINCRRYVPALVLYGDITSGSPVIENIVMGSGAAPDLASVLAEGDFIYVDEDVDRIIDPANATLVTLDNVGKELTFGGNFLRTQARMRLGVFVRAAMPNA